MRIHRIQTGRVRVKTNQVSRAPGFAPALVKVLLGREWSQWLPIHAWVIEHPEGVIVVDTGETARVSEAGYFPAWQPYYKLAVELDVQPEVEIGVRLTDLGIRPETDVRTVVMTHLHTDHAGGLHWFPNSEILVHETEFAVAQGLAGKLAGYLPHRWPAWLSPTQVNPPGQRFGPFPRSMPLTKDGRIQLVPTPGHTEGHMSVIAELGELYYFLAGDTSYNQDNLLRGLPDGIGTADTLPTLRRIQDFARAHPTVYLPSHDPDGATRLEQRQIVPLYEGDLPEEATDLGRDPAGG